MAAQGIRMRDVCDGFLSYRHPGLSGAPLTSNCSQLADRNGQDKPGPLMGFSK